MFKKLLSCCIASTLSVISTSGLAQQNEGGAIASEDQMLAPLMTASAESAIKNQYIVVLKPVSYTHLTLPTSG